MSERLLDLRGLRCPWPALRVGRALREGAGDLVALADDPQAPAEIGAVAAAWGLTVEALAMERGTALRLARGGPQAPIGNAPFTPPPS